MKLVNVTAIKTFICGIAVGITAWSIGDYIARIKRPVDKETIRKIKELLTNDEDHN